VKWKQTANTKHRFV